MSTSRGPILFNQGLRPFFELPDHIKPPPGFPFVVLPADPVTDAPKAERRKLAENVVCMFSEDREPIVNMRWRGRYPPNVDRRYHWGQEYDRLHSGDYCIIWPRPESRFQGNRGIVVQLIEPDQKTPRYWHVRAVSRPAQVRLTHDPDNRDGYGERWEFMTLNYELRRCAPPSRLIT